MKNRDLFGDHFEYIRKNVLSRCKSRNNRDDIVGIVIVRIIKEANRFDPHKGTFKTFLEKRIKGRIVDAIRSLTLYGNHRSPGRQANMPRLSAEDAPIGAGIVLGRTMAELPERWRRVLEMRFRDDQTCEEIAQELGVSVWTVVQTTRKALVEMKRLLAARGVTKVGDVL